MNPDTLGHSEDYNFICPRRRGDKLCTSVQQQLVPVALLLTVSCGLQAAPSTLLVSLY